MRPRLFLLLVLTALLVGSVARAAFADRDSEPQAKKHTVAKKQVLTPAQKAARKKLLAQAEFMKENDLNCGCRHHFPAP